MEPLPDTAAQCWTSTENKLCLSEVTYLLLGYFVPDPEDKDSILIAWDNFHIINPEFISWLSAEMSDALLSWSS